MGAKLSCERAVLGCLFFWWEDQFPSPTQPGQSVSPFPPVASVAWWPGLVGGIPPLALFLLWGWLPLSRVREKRYQPLQWLLSWSATATLPPHSLPDAWLSPAWPSSTLKRKDIFFSGSELWIMSMLCSPTERCLNQLYVPFEMQGRCSEEGSRLHKSSHPLHAWPCFVCLFKNS